MFNAPPATTTARQVTRSSEPVARSMNVTASTRRLLAEYSSRETRAPKRTFSEPRFISGSTSRVKALKGVPLGVSVVSEP